MPHSIPLFNRSDTLFGVCEGLGRDFGFHPNILRIALGIGLMWNPVFVIGAYAAMGVAVYAARFLFPAVVPTDTAAHELTPAMPTNDGTNEGTNDTALTADRLAA